MTKTIHIEGMTCSHCTGRVEKALNAVNGVTVQRVSVDDKSAIIEVENISDDLLKEIVEDAGYDVIKIS
jgi:copper chaperone CopZ